MTMRRGWEEGGFRVKGLLKLFLEILGSELNGFKVLGVSGFLVLVGILGFLGLWVSI